MPRIPLIEDLTSGPIPAGSNLLVGFDPASQWYNASLTITAGWIGSGGIASYNVWSQPPENVRLQLKRLGLAVEALETDEKLRIIDWYTIQLGQKSKEKYAMTSLKIADLSILYSKALIPSTGSAFPGTAWHLGPNVLRISDDQLRLLRFNDEKSFIDFWHARMLPNAPARKSTVIYSVVKDIYPDHVYKTMESSVDGIVDVKIDEEGGEVRSLMRIRNMRSIGYHSHWHPLKVDENFRVALEK